MKKIYTGIGSREIDKPVADMLKEYAIELSNLNFACRTGDATGSDNIFKTNSKVKYAYSTKDVEFGDWTDQELLKSLPNDRSNPSAWKPYVQKLTKRSMKQVLGPNGNNPSDFILCWAPSTNYTDSSSGGTGYAIRCALRHRIPVYNLYSSMDRIDFDTLLNTLK